MMEKQLVDNYNTIVNNIKTAPKKNGDVIFLAATKTQDAKTINEAIDLGLNYIGENRVQEFLSKNDQINPAAHRHFIGHLQTNKVKDIVGKVELIHSVDSYKLAAEIDRQSKKLGIKTDILLEVNIGAEESKSGFSPSEIQENIVKISSLSSVRIMGLMCIPPICEQKEENRKYFSKMYNIFIDIKSKKIDNSNMVYLSMGMSDDYDVAISEGANIVRIGTALFGKRNYNIL